MTDSNVCYFIVISTMPNRQLIKLIYQLKKKTITVITYILKIV